MMAAHVSQQVSTYSGPIPPPDLLKKFDEIDPGRAARLMDWAEDQSRHRMAIEARVIKNDIIKSWVGLVSAFVLTMTAIILGFILIYCGHDWAGSVVSTSGLAGLAGTFIYGTSSQRRERTEKAMIMSGRK
jgi:uncharacterized membrane protein